MRSRTAAGSGCSRAIVVRGSAWVEWCIPRSRDRVVEGWNYWRVKVVWVAVAVAV